jgi:hypothetical protein
MPEIWPVNLTPADKQLVIQLQARRARLGLGHSYAQTLRDAVALAMTASDEDLVKGEL